MDCELTEWSGHSVRSNLSFESVHCPGRYLYRSFARKNDSEFKVLKVRERLSTGSTLARSGWHTQREPRTKWSDCAKPCSGVRERSRGIKADVQGKQGKRGMHGMPKSFVSS